MGHNDPRTTVDHKLRTIRESSYFGPLFRHSRAYLSNCIHSSLGFHADVTNCPMGVLDRILG